MSTAIGTALIAAIVSLIVGLVGAFVTVNLNRATAVKYLTEAAEKTGLENKRLNETLIRQRKCIVCLIHALDKVVPILPASEPLRNELRELADEARINLL